MHPGTRRPAGPTQEGAPVQYAESVVDLVGNTPLVRLTSVTRDLGPDAPLVLAKVEYLNPGGSVKDRIAVRMVDEAEASGARSEEHTSELQSRQYLVCRLLLEKKKQK